MSKAPRLSNRSTGGGTSVYEWGVLGDGTFNETLKIQRALDNLQHVYFPPGTYLVDGSLTASLDKQVIEGAGKGSVIKMMASKTYDLTQQHAAFTMNAGEQTLQDLQLIGPDTGDDSTFSGSGSDWYNLSALRVDGPSSTVNGIKIDRCEGMGMLLSQADCEVSLCYIERTGLDGLRNTARRQLVSMLRATNCTQAVYSNITTYPSQVTSAVKIDENDTVVSGCYTSANTRGITCTGLSQVICNNQCRDGMHVTAQNAIISNNFIRASNNNAITVANNGQSSITSLTGNDVDPMDQGGADDIIAPSSYSEYPVKHATSNFNPDIDRIYQQKVYADIRPGDDQTPNPSDGHVPLYNADYQQVINIDQNNDTISVPRPAVVQITAPPVRVNTEFNEGRFEIRGEDNDTRPGFNTVRVNDNSTSTIYALTPCTLQASLEPDTPYKMYIFSDPSNNTAADLTYDEKFKIIITDLE